MTDYDDETLGAYVDGELPAAKAEAMTADIRANAELRQRVAELQHINLALRASYTELARPQMAPWRRSLIRSSLTDSGTVSDRGSHPGDTRRLPPASPCWWVSALVSSFTFPARRHRR